MRAMKNSARNTSTRCGGRDDANSAASDDPNALADSSRDPPGNTAFDCGGDAISFLAIQNMDARTSAISSRTDDAQEPSTGSPTYFRIARPNDTSELLASYPIFHDITPSGGPWHFAGWLVEYWEGRALRLKAPAIYQPSSTMIGNRRQPS